MITPTILEIEPTLACASRSTPTTLVERLRGLADDRPEALAFAELDDAGRVRRHLTYAELDRLARRLAGRLRGSAEPGARMLLLFPAGLDVIAAFFGCLYAGAVAIPAPPPEASRLKHTLPRLRSIAADAGASIAIAGPTIRRLLDGSGEIPGLDSVEFLFLADLDEGDEDAWAGSAAQPDDLAYLQYTSGSTSTPRGVMISHRNVIHHCEYLRRCGEYDSESLTVTWLPYFHDYGLIEGLMVPLSNGTPAYMMSPFAFLKRPSQWLEAITRLRATHTQAPNFAYEHCVRRIRPDQLDRIDLSSLRSAGNGAEPINPKVLQAFHRTFAPLGLKWEACCPAYGLAEATLMVSCSSPSIEPKIGRFQAEALADGQVVEAAPVAGNVREVTSCGPVVGQFDLAIVDPETRVRRGPSEIGEVWLRDPSVALGYWRRHSETDQTFRATIEGSGEGPYLRTGDLGFLHNGELYLTGRIKDLIIIAGANHAPQDIEWTIEQCDPDIRPSGVAAFPVSIDGEERLAVAAEVERGALPSHADTARLLEAIRRAVAEEHEVSIHAAVLLARGSLPKTASGKIRRHECARMLDPNSPEVLASWVAGTTRIPNARMP